MKIKNYSGIPEAIFNFLLADFYDGDVKGDSYSATELLKPIQEIILTRRHWKEIEVDAIDRLWSLFGQGVHAVLEKEKGIEPIQRMFAEVLGKRVSGKVDRIKDNKITDYKVTSAWTIVFGDRVEEWKIQLSEYRWLYWKNNGVVLDDTGSIIAILRDWSDKNLREGGKYPQVPIVEIPIKLMSIEDTESFITKKIQAIMDAETMDKLPECSDKDRWYNPKKKLYMRCAKYCPASKFCSQFKAEKDREDLIFAEEEIV